MTRRCQARRFQAFCSRMYRGMLVFSETSVMTIPSGQLIRTIDFSVFQEK